MNGKVAKCLYYQLLKILCISKGKRCTEGRRAFSGMSLRNKAFS